MLHTLGFRPTTGNNAHLVLGVFGSECTGPDALEFSVPAHVMATFNVVLDGALWLEGRQLDPQFVTGCQTRSRRYVLSAGARLLTLFCRADALTALSGRPARQFTDQWLTPQALFGAAATAPLTVTSNQAWTEVADAMLACVAPLQTSPPPDGPTARRQTQLQRALLIMNQHSTDGLAAATRAAGIGERSLQRLFQDLWGVSPKLVLRMLRIQRCLELWQRAPGSLADLAAAVGLSDQAHLAREFRELVGSEPRQLHKPSGGDLAGPTPDPLWALRAGSAFLSPLLLSDFSKTGVGHAR